MARERDFFLQDAAMRRKIRKMIREELRREQQFSQSYQNEPYFEEEHEPWAVFGEPQLDPHQEAAFRKRPPQVQEWGEEPFFPEYGEMDTPPLVPTPKRKRKRT
ncbi:hypothetical protein SAMN05444392_102221 [Seinonella peptonophila]|uniref:Uncharacterized protein n=1 Tax=Seinonella peptonophila TaxID=112248 RepID=A0A1M4V8B0_9BACL|nr:hypothetical protein [Seinonella peptonophila]SHE65088.1 hypothetical protein SAMN05444392_102221 [Seinonella peptonophila]